jgi:TatD DNase family protein
MITFVDTHCHLDLMKDIQNNPYAEDTLPIKTISVTNAPFLFSANQELFKNCKNIRIALGMHPELISRYSGQISEFVKYIRYTKYIGEIGLDGSKDFQNHYNLQKSVFEQILGICKQANGKILTIHSRNAALETITLLNKNLKGSTCKVILHWFSGSLSELEIASQSGFYFSVNHKMTSTEKGRRIVTAIPRRLLLTETDAPFTFDQVAKNRLESLQETVRNIAIIKGVGEDELKAIIFNNFSSLLNSVQ